MSKAAYVSANNEAAVYYALYNGFYTDKRLWPMQGTDKCEYSLWNSIFTCIKFIES